MSKYEYLEKYIDYTYHEKYNDVRKQLHASIIDDHFKNKFKNEKKQIIFIAGCYCTGKSYFVNSMKKQIIDENNFVFVDMDNIRKNIPEYITYLEENMLTAPIKTNKESGYIAELIQFHALSNGYSLIVDESMKDFEWKKQYLIWINKTFPEYEIIIIFISSSKELIFSRNKKRFDIEKRFIDQDFLEKVYEQTIESFNSIKTLDFISKIYIYDNNLDATSYDMSNIIL